MIGFLSRVLKSYRPSVRPSVCPSVRYKSCLSDSSLTTQVNLMKLQRKIGHNAKMCRAHGLGSYGGWSGGAMVLGKLPVPERPTIWMIVGQGPIALAVGAGGGCLDIFTLLYPFSSFFLSLGDDPI